MASEPPSRDRGLPLLLRVIASTPGGPLVAGLLITAAVFLAFMTWARVSGIWGRSDYGLQVWFELLQAAMIGYAPAACAISLRGALRDLEDLRGVLELDPAEFEDAREAIARFRPRHLLVAVAVGAAVGLAIPFYPPGWPGGVLPGLGDPLFTWALLRSVVMIGLYGSTIYIEVEVARRLSHLGERSARVDLLDLAPLRPFARRGLRSVLLWVVLSVFISLLFLAPWSSDPALGFLFFIVALAAGLLLLPAWGIHRRILDGKQRELTRVREVIGFERRGLLDADAGRPTGRLADAVAYEARVASIPTWPFDVSTLVRFALYVALGLGSWLGAAVVERFVDVVLG